MIDPADPDQLFALLRRHRIDPKHSLGQNFMVDAAIRDRVADAAGITSEDEVLEVGAGAGALTVALAHLSRRLIAVELDRRLIPVLRDVVGVDQAVLFSAGGHIVAGNIPYNLTGGLIRKLLDAPPRPRRLCLVVQKEVAERWTAASGASLATVAVQVFATARLVFTIPASAFMPPPRVDSACVVLDVREHPAVNVPDLDSFFRLVEAVFQFRRKQLGGALGRISETGSTSAGARLREVGIDPERRPQTLSLAEWETVYTAFNRAPDR